MGECVVVLEPGDLLVVDNLKLHQVMDAPDLNTRVVVISFLPEFVYSLGSPSHDYAFLMPFYSKIEGRPQVLRRADLDAAPACRAIAELLEHYFAGTPGPFHQAGSKALLLKLLFHLARHFESAEVLRWEFLRQQERTARLKNLFEHIARHYPDKLSVSAASRLCGLSAPQFMKLFKQVAGMTLVAYLHHVRLSNAARLLRETNHSIAEIADRVGFADQSYFDRRFKKSFGQSPKAFREAGRAG
jgi:AraC-like DNA-binding protein